MSAAALPTAEPVRHPLPRVASGRLVALVGGTLGTVALGAILVISFRIAAAATAQPQLLVPSAQQAGFPPWLAGPLWGYGSPLAVPTLNTLLVVLGVLYVVVLVCSRSIPVWIGLGGAAVAIAIFTLSPPLFSTDIFNYVAYARLGVVHHLNPYVHGAAAFPTDPSYAFTGKLWKHTPTTYGPLFTLISYAFVSLGVSGAMWGLKVLTALSALACGALIWFCAKRLGARPLPAVLFFALNPLLLVYAIGGGHNDVLMALPLLAGALLILRGQPLLGGAALMAAAGIKPSAALVIPFVLVASSARWRILAGAMLGAAALLAVGYLGFGADVFRLGHTLSVDERFKSELSSVPGYLGTVLDLGRITVRWQQHLHLAFGAGALALLVVAWRRRNWIPAACAAVILLLATSTWLFPWYILWALPLAPLARRRWVTLTVLAFTALLVAIQVHHNDAFLHREARTGTTVVERPFDRVASAPPGIFDTGTKT
jgi:Glycosyltransferase family 87